MKLYLTAAGIYAGTQVEAKADGKGWRLEEVPTDKYGLIDYLNKLVHREEIEALSKDALFENTERPPADKETSVFPRATPGYTEQSVATDKAFDDLPLARQLDLAARAMENAREKL